MTVKRNVRHQIHEEIKPCTRIEPAAPKLKLQCCTYWANRIDTVVLPVSVLLSFACIVAEMEKMTSYFRVSFNFPSSSSITFCMKARIYVWGTLLLVRIASITFCLSKSFKYNLSKPLSDRIRHGTYMSHVWVYFTYKYKCNTLVG